ncbi:MAG: ABC transporter permease [Oscillospiraceae bacterium]|jgi:putative ABC transport system permease protein|nr:ABC transporter permease [Oscillospiraceae bacterium]
MNVMSKLALEQLKSNRRRTILTGIGIVLSVAMLTAVSGFVMSAIDAWYQEAIADGRDPQATLAGFAETITAIGIILGGVIMVGSVVAIANAFNISANERVRQFGILKSVGATSKQIRASVMYEGLWFAAIAIPVGVIVGFGVDAIGVALINGLIGGVIESGENLVFRVMFAWQVVLIAAGASFVTIVISAWLPARKTSRIPAIDAIRQSGEMKLSTKSVKTSKLTQTLFGFEGTLAAKSLKRSKRKYRATVVSLVISVVLFMISFNFGQMLNAALKHSRPLIDADYTIARNDGSNYGDDSPILTPQEVDEITEKLGQYGTISLVRNAWAGTDENALPHDFTTNELKRYYNSGTADPEYLNDNTGIWEGACTDVRVMQVERALYLELCKQAGVPDGSNLLVNTGTIRDGEDKTITFRPFNFRPMTLVITPDYSEETIEISIQGELRDIPPTVAMEARSSPPITIIVPSVDAGYVATNWWYIKSTDPHFITAAAQIFSEYGINSLYVEDIRAEIQQLKDIYNVVMIFIYGFVAMLTLIGVSGVISTISTNIRARRREFAALTSVGLTPKGLTRMLNLESLMYGMKSLIIGLPIGLIISAGLHVALGISTQFGYTFPWQSMVYSALGVFAVTFISMRYARGQVKGGSIVETLKQDS